MGKGLSGSLSRVWIVEYSILAVGIKIFAIPEVADETDKKICSLYTIPKFHSQYQKQFI